MSGAAGSAAARTRHGIFILLRRLRVPLSILILVYAMAVAGFTLVPGIDPQGRPWHMSLLQAFYFVSFLGTTIGLGEIPQPFSDLQRLWATAAIYGTVGGLALRDRCVVQRAAVDYKRVSCMQGVRLEAMFPQWLEVDGY